jgi:hypothetical protein
MCGVRGYLAFELVDGWFGYGFSPGSKLGELLVFPPNASHALVLWRGSRWARGTHRLCAALFQLMVWRFQQTELEVLNRVLSVVAELLSGGSLLARQ